MDLISRIQAYMRANAAARLETLSVGRFTLFLHPTDTGPDESFAVPNIPMAGEEHASLSEIESVFAERGRVPCVQFVDSYAPSLASRLQEAGYHERKHWPVLACTRLSLRAPPAVPGLEMVTLSSESSLEDVREGWNVNALGFDPSAELATDEQADEFRKSLVSARAFTARLGGTAVGAGMFVDVRDGLTELMGITTLERYRRRSIATHLTAFATSVAFDLGVEIAFLVAASDEAARVYRRIGYDPIGSFLAYRLEGSRA